EPRGRNVCDRNTVLRGTTMDGDSDRQVLAERLRTTREYLDFSQQDAADRSGMTRAALSAIETGRRKVESIELAALAKTYKCPVGFFIGEEPEDDETVVLLGRTARDLTARDRQEVLRFARFLRSPASARPSTRRP